MTLFPSTTAPQPPIASNTSTPLSPTQSLHHFGLIIVIGLFIVTRLTFYFLEETDFLFRLPQQDDAPTYLDLASVYAGLQTYDSVDRSPFTRVPVYPQALAFFSSIMLPARYILLFTIQQVLQLIIIITVYFYLRYFYSGRIALLASTGLILFYDFAIYGFLIRPEVLFTAFVLTACLFLLRALSTNSTIWFFVSAIFLSLATLTRPVAALSIFPLLGITIYFAKSYLSLRLLFIRLLIILAAYILPLAPWLYHNYLLSGSLVLQQDTGNLIHATVPGGHWGSVDIHELLDTTNTTELALDRALTTEALKRIKNNPTIWVKNTLANFTYRLWSMGFADTYLRYLDHTQTDPGGYHAPLSPPLWQRLLSSWNIFSPRFSINPMYHLYFVVNNIFGIFVSVLPLIGLVLFPFLPSSSKVIFIFLLYFWFITSFFAFSGSRYMVPILPLLWLVVPSYQAAARQLFHLTHP